MAELSPVLPSAARAGPASARPPGPPAEMSAKDRRLHDAASALEAQFLSEMLKHTGLGKAPEGFGGGIGEEQFSSFLRDEQAREMTRHGGIGLTERLFEALKAREDHAG